MKSKGFYELEKMGQEAKKTSHPIQIITPVFNEGRILLQTFESIKNQTFKNFEWILVNDGSENQETLDVLAQVEEEEYWIKVIQHSENLGLPAARNTGINEASSPFLFFLDADDLIDSTMLEKAYLVCTLNDNVSFVNSFVVGFGAQDYHWTGGFHDREIFLKENRNTSCFLARREVFDHILFDETLKNGCEDWDFWLKAASKGFWGYTIPEYLFFYRRSAVSKWSSMNDRNALAQMQKQFYSKYTTDLSKGFPEIHLTDYSFGYKAPKLVDPELEVNVTQTKHILCLFPWLKIGGADQYNYNLLEGLRNKGWSVTIITTLGSDHPWEKKFKKITPDVFHLDNLAKEVNFSSLLEYLIATRKPKLLFLSNSMYGYYTLPYIKQRFPNLPVVDYVHCEDIGWYGGGYPYFSSLYSDFIDHTYTTSNNLRSWCIQKGSQSNRISVCYINVDTASIKRDNIVRERLRADLKVKHSVPIILYVARLTEQKQPIVLLQTIDALRVKGLQFYCVIIGDGPDQKLVLDFINEKKLDSHVKYLGSQPNNMVMQYMDAADIFFLPSKYEGIALSIYEAMAKELAIVGASVGGQAELVTEECGYLVQTDEGKNSVNEYAQILSQLICNPGRITALGSTGRARVEQFFDIKHMVDHMDASLMRIVASEVVDSDALPNSYLSMLNRVVYLEKENAFFHNQSNTKLFSILSRYSRPYKRLKEVYHTIRGIAKV